MSNVFITGREGLNERKCKKPGQKAKRNLGEIAWLDSGKKESKLTQNIL
ncbi:MAG TPA: hypothetical protein HA306_09125 [Methanosarcina sp.]|nr:hypothetical protein [Methanosarcina sp.]